MSVLDISAVGMSVVGDWISQVRDRAGSNPAQSHRRESALESLPGLLAALASRVRRSGLTYLAEPKLASLLELAIEMEQRREPGTFVEAGCALGGSAITLTATKSADRAFLVYDVFGMIPAPGELDGEDVHERYQIISSGQSAGINGNRYYGYETDLHAKVTESFDQFGYPVEKNAVSLVKGLVQETLTDNRPVCLAHIDVDWYDPVMTCLERIVPRLTPHGAIVLDDYLDWSGCLRATDDYFERVGRENFTFDESAGHLVVRRAR